MKLQRTAVLAVPREQAETILREYFSSAGYLFSENAYQRGSLMGSLFGFNPKSLRTKVMVRWPSQNQVEVLWEINDAFQAVTKEDHEFWDSEANGALRVLQGGPPPLPEERSGEKSVKRAVTILTVMVILAAVAGIFSGVFSAQLGKGSSGGMVMGGILGALVAVVVTLVMKGPKKPQ
jgi:hypothetical protein